MSELWDAVFVEDKTMNKTKMLRKGFDTWVNTPQNKMTNTRCRECHSVIHSKDCSQHTHKAKEAQHTPGLEKIREFRLHDSTTDSNGKPYYSVEAIWGNDKLGSTIYQGYDGDLARLIAAAPELLEALKAMVNMEDWGDADDYSTVGKAKAAIAKAEAK